MDLDHVKARLDGALRPVHKTFHDPPDALLRERLRDRERIRERHVAGAHDVVGPPPGGLVRDEAHVEEGREGGGFAAGVGELDPDLLVLGVRELDDACPGGGLLVCPDPGAFGGDAAFGEDCCCFDDGEPGAAGEDAADCGGGVKSEGQLRG